MTLCAGLCSFQPRSGFCSIRLSEPLLKLRPRSDLINTLLHEMIHAYIFVSSPVRDREDHGPIFQSHMRRINESAGTNITVYHTFHDEVDAYRQHWWQCDGPCRRKAPYFGLVKRSMNRVPGPLDRWWEEHQRTCGGVYTKIKEPPGFKEKQEKKLQKQARKKKKEQDATAQPSVKNFFEKAEKPPTSERQPKRPKLEDNATTEKLFVKDDEAGKPATATNHETNPPTEIYLSEGMMVAAGEDGEFYLVGDISAMFQNESALQSESAVLQRTADSAVVDLTASDDEDIETKPAVPSSLLDGDSIILEGPAPPKKTPDPAQTPKEVIEID
ncbi:hypothetical protein PINS_up012101 [Pythium insidiosum]|nr:hypothetical protein PINS_up012101 [Pythium insidiosum]